jgi:hypothetical protein
MNVGIKIIEAFIVSCEYLCDLERSERHRDFQFGKESATSSPFTFQRLSIPRDMFKASISLTFFPFLHPSFHFSILLSFGTTYLSINCPPWQLQLNSIAPLFQLSLLVHLVDYHSVLKTPAWIGRIPQIPKQRLRNKITQSQISISRPNPLQRLPDWRMRMNRTPATKPTVLVPNCHGVLTIDIPFPGILQCHTLLLQQPIRPGHRYLRQPNFCSVLDQSLVAHPRWQLVLERN